MVEVDEKAIKEGLENLAKNAQNFEDRKKGSKSKDGDQLNINFLGKINGEEFEHIKVSNKIGFGYTLKIKSS